LRERMELSGPFVEKELLRGHRLEALEFYRALVVPSLVAALRMRYVPRHYDFRMRYVYRELPPDVVRRLEGLAFVTDPEDLATKYISDLGVRAGAAVFNTSIILLGITILATSWFLLRAFKDPILMIVVLLAGVGAVGVGVFTEAFGFLHTIVSFITFLFAGLS